MSDILYRPATLDDAEAISAVYVESASLAERGVIPDASLDAMVATDYVDSWHRRIGSPFPHGAWVALVKGAVVGVSYVMPDEEVPETAPALHVDMLYVRPGHAGRGIGAALLTMAIEHTRAAGYKRATLWALRQNARTRRFYEREGWTTTGVEHVFEDDGYVVPVVQYARSLTAPETD
jgi:GNAT superfamily N-acetyltransferase